ncbi:MAG: hypothetical protein ACFNON_07010, partial [Veillonella parvula]
RPEALREVYYAFNRADLLPESTPALEALYQMLTDNPEVKILKKELLEKIERLDELWKYQEIIDLIEALPTEQLDTACGHYLILGFYEQR